MNATQRNILKGALAAVSITMLFPPFHLVGPFTVQLGYGFLFSPPAYGSAPGTVDVPLLLAEWLLVGIVGAILWALKRGHKTSSLAGEIIITIRTGNDARVEAARILADATIRAAEITSARSAQIDLLDHHR